MLDSYRINVNELYVKVPKGYSSVESNAVAELDKFLTEVVLPEGVENIDSNTFSNCNELETITLRDASGDEGEPNNLHFRKLKVIGDSAFWFCDKLTIEELHLPNIEEIGDEAFDNTKIEKLHIGCEERDYSEPLTIGKSAFESCDIEEITLEAGIEELKGRTFADNSFKCIELPTTLKTIGDEVFVDCTNLTSVVIPESVTAIGKGVFEGCTKLKSVKLGGIRVLREGLFKGCPIETLEIPASVEDMEEGSFAGCTSLKSVRLLEGIKMLRKNIFRDCPIETLEIPASVEEMEDGCFAGMKTLKKVVFKGEPKRITPAMFEGCENLEEINIGSSVHDFDPTLFLISRAWRKVTLQAPVRELPGELFKLCQKLESITLSDTIETLGDKCFYGCIKLKEFRFPSQLKTIGKNCFDECRGINAIELPGQLKTIGESAFAHCSITKVVLPEGLVTCGTSIFAHCKDLKEISLPSTLKSAKGIATGTESLIITGNIESLPEKLLEDCDVKEVILPEGLKSIGEYCFSRCKKLTSVSVPAAVTRLDQGAFYGCRALTEVHLPEGLTEISDFLFSDCSSLAELHIPSGVKKIGEEAFDGCKKLTSVNLPEGLAEIGDKAFKNCTSLPSLQLPEGVKLGKEVFALSDKLLKEVSKQDAFQAQDEEVKKTAGGSFWTKYGTIIVIAIVAVFFLGAKYVIPIIVVLIALCIVFWRFSSIFNKIFHRD